MLARSQLREGSWYLGRCWAGPVALWDGEFFVTIRSGAIKEISYGGCVSCFAPYHQLEG